MAEPGTAVPPRLRSPPEACARLTLYELVDERDGGHAAARDPAAVARRMSVDDARAVCLAPAGEALRAALEQTDDAGGDDPVVPVAIEGSTFDVVLEPEALADDALSLYVMVGWDAVAELRLQVVKAVVAAIDRARGRFAPPDRGGTGDPAQDAADLREIERWRRGTAALDGAVEDLAAMVSAALVRIEPRVHELCVARANLARDRTAAELDRYAVKGRHSGGFLVWDVTKPEQRQETLAALAPAFDRRDRIVFLKSVEIDAREVEDATAFEKAYLEQIHLERQLPADGPHPFAAMVALSSGALVREVATEHLAELLVTVFREAEKLMPPKPLAGPC